MVRKSIEQQNALEDVKEENISQIQAKESQELLSSMESDINKIEEIIGISLINNQKEWIDANFEIEQLKLLGLLIKSTPEHTYEYNDDYEYTLSTRALEFLKRYRLTQESVTKLQSMYNTYYGRCNISFCDIVRFFEEFDGKPTKIKDITDSKAYQLLIKYANTPYFTILWYLNPRYNFKLELSTLKYDNIVELVENLSKK